MKINVCVGSSCHLKGSYDVIKKLKELIEKHNVADKLEISGAFCLGHCSNGVTVRMGEEYLENFNVDNVEEKFVTEILTRL